MYAVFERLCQERGVTPYKVSQATGISRTTFSDWKKGTYQLKMDKLQKIADYFDVSVEYLQTGKQPTGYYLNEETAQIAQEIFDDPRKRALFDASRKATPEALELVAKMLEELNK